MAGVLSFNRDYAEFGSQIRDFEKDYSVGIVVSEFLWFEGTPYYPVGDLINANITSVWLGEGEPQNEESIDLVFRMPTGSEEVSYFYEIVLRVDDQAVYGGWAFGDKLTVTDEIVSGHRVLESDDFGNKARFVYSPTRGRYVYSETPSLRATALRARQIAKRRR